MSIARSAVWLIERLPVPDAATRAGIHALVARTRRRLALRDAAVDEAAFATDMAARRIAEFTRDANRQHYELPAEFFGLVLGPRPKYSCCFYDDQATMLATAEERALEATAVHADLADGQAILELGCGWGALSLWMAERYPKARITAVSNSHPQRLHIETAARSRGIGNLTVVTADMNDYRPAARYDRIVSVEMFEHMANWPSLLDRIRQWLAPEGCLFLHVFSHRSVPYRFDHNDKADWIARHFFTGGIMPSHGLIRHFGEFFAVDEAWRWSGNHYERTAEDWLANLDRNADLIRPLLRQVYGDAAGVWERRWRLFFLATSGLFGDRGGTGWGVSHYRLRPRR